MNSIKCVDGWINEWMYCGGSYVKTSAVVPDAVEFLIVWIDNLVAGKTGEQCVQKKHSISQNIQSLKPPPKIFTI